MLLWGNELSQLPDYVLISEANLISLTASVGADMPKDQELQIAIDNELEYRWQSIREEMEQLWNYQQVQFPLDIQ